jgi:hypothetical protein
VSGDVVAGGVPGVGGAHPQGVRGAAAGRGCRAMLVSVAAVGSAGDVAGQVVRDMSAVRECVVSSCGAGEAEEVVVREDEHMPKQPPFEPDPLEVALAERLELPLAEVVAGSFDLVEHRTFTGTEKVSVKWRQVMSVDGEEQVQEQHAELPYADVRKIQDRLAGRLG